MSGIVTDVERLTRHSTPGSGRVGSFLWRALLPVAALVIVCSCILVPLARPAAAATLTSAKAQAAQLEQEITSTGQQITALDQSFDAAEQQKAAVDGKILITESEIVHDRRKVSTDRRVLRKAAVDAYISGGTSPSSSLFSGSQTSTIDARFYDNVAEGDLGQDVAGLQSAQDQLDAEETSLHQQEAAAAAAEASAHAAVQQAQVLEAQQTQALNQVKGQIATLIAQQEKAAQAAATAAAQAQIEKAQAAAAAAAAAAPAVAAPTASNLVTVSDPPPPAAAGGSGSAAVAAAESQLGVPYRWAAETPRPTSPNPGFDCSGLTAWAWGRAGVPLPHYSGAQMADSTPVPLSDLQPGDLLFYGPTGSEHVAMYVGTGEQIEAPYTGASVWITALRTNTGTFVGAGRP